MCELLRQTLAAASVTHLVSKCSLRPTLCWEHCSGHWDIPLCSEKPDKPESCVHTHENSRWWQGLLRSFLREWGRRGGASGLTQDKKVSVWSSSGFQCSTLESRALLHELWNPCFCQHPLHLQGTHGDSRPCSDSA